MRFLTCHTAPTFACSKSSCEKRASLVLSEVLSLCLSRACLGKSIVFGLNTAQKEACFLFFVAPRSSSRRGSVRKCRSLVKCFPLVCLSRACLGKMIAFIVCKMASQKDTLSYLHSLLPAARSQALDARGGVGQPAQHQQPETRQGCY